MSSAVLSIHRRGEQPVRARLRDLGEIWPHEIALRPDHQEIFDYLCGSPLWGFSFEKECWVRWRKP